MKKKKRPVRPDDWTPEQIDVLIAAMRDKRRFGYVVAAVNRLGPERTENAVRLKMQALRNQDDPKPQGTSTDESEERFEPLFAAAREAPTCKWPIGDPLDDDFRFCGEEATKGSYCEEHASNARASQKKEHSEHAP